MNATLLLALLGVGCQSDDPHEIEETQDSEGSDAGSDAGSDGGGEETPTWHQDIAPLMSEHCGACHEAGGLGGFQLTDYKTASSMADYLVEVVSAGEMPPWGARETEECTPPYGWKNDLRLPEDQLALLQAWADAGAPEGDPETAAPLPAPPDLSLTDANMQLRAESAYSTSGSEDEFICFVMDPELTEDAWLTGSQVVPGDDKVVHHVLLFTDPNREGAGKANDEGWYQCFGDAGVSDASLLAAWAPGGFPAETPEGTGIPVEAGSLLIMQVHYHPNGSEASDQSGIDLRWSYERPEKEALLALIGNASSERQGLLSGPNDRSDSAEFRIPAAATDHTETIEYTLPGSSGAEYTLFSVGTHMHYIGRDMIIKLLRASTPEGEPAEECLIQTPDWDFNWQRGYDYDAPLDQAPVMRGGDTLWMRCTYDNTTENPGVLQALSDAGLSEPVDVYLGEETLDEMCLGVFGVVY